MLVRVTTSAPSQGKLAHHPYQCPGKQCIKSSPWSLLSETHGHLSQDPTDALPRTPPHTPIGQELQGPWSSSFAGLTFLQHHISPLLPQRSPGSSRFLPFQQQLGAQQ